MSWMQQEATVEFFKLVKFNKEEAKEDWAKEMFVADNLQDWALKNATALGGVIVLNQILNMEFAPDEERKRDTP